MPHDFVQRMELALQRHPTLLLTGPPGVTEFRLLQVMYHHWMPTEDDKSLLWSRTHPDVTLFDARTLKTDEARAVRGNLTAAPARLQFRLLIVLYAERIHSSAAQTLLKLVEEPPSRLRTLFGSECPKLMLPTLVSRSIQLRVPRLSQRECADVLTQQGIESPEWRAENSSSDPLVGSELDRETVEDWTNLWKAMISGATPPPTFAWFWTDKFRDKGDSTELVCWNALLRLAVSKLRLRVWRDISKYALRERNRVVQGQDQKMTTPNSLAIIYALVKTQNGRSAS